MHKTFFIYLNLFVILFLFSLLCMGSSYEEEINYSFLVANLGIIIFILVIISMFLHMVYVCFKGERYQKEFTGFEMVKKRLEAGMPECMSKEEFQQTNRLIEKASESWRIVKKSTKISIGIRRKKREFNKAIVLINHSISLLPTEESLLKKINRLTNEINEEEKRRFQGVRKIVILILILSLLMYLVTDLWTTFFCWLLLFYTYLPVENHNFLSITQKPKQTGSI